MKDFLEGLAALLNVKAEEVSELFDADGKPKEGTDLLTTARSWVKTRTDDVYKSAERKTANRFENFVKSKGFESDAQGVDLLEAYYESLKSHGDGKGGEWEKKYNDLFPKVEKLQAALTEKDAAIQAAIKQGERKEVAARLMSDVRKTLGDKWAGTEDHFQILMKNFDVNRIRYENGQPVILDESGEIAKDELHRPISFADEAKKMGSLIGGFHVVPPGKDGPPPPTGKGAPPQKVSLPDGMTDREFLNLYGAEKDPAKRLEIMNARIAQTEK